MSAGRGPLPDLDFTPWPAAEAARYRRLGLWRGETLGDWLHALALRHGSRTAVVDGDEHLSYADLDARADRLARRLATVFGVTRGERVLLQLPNRAVFVPVLVALARLGAVPVLGLPAHRASEVRHLLHVSGATAWVLAAPPVARPGAPAPAGDRFDHRALAREVAPDAPALRHVLVAGDPGQEEGFAALEDPADATGPHPGTGPWTAGPVDPGDVAFLNLSGGSTGLPKLIPRTHDDYLCSVRESARVCGLDTASVYLCVLPVQHNFTLSSPGVLGVLHAGGRVVMAPAPDPGTCFALMQAHGVTCTSLVPPLAKLWLDAAEARGLRPATLRTVQVGGARLSDEVARRVRPVLGCTLQQVFGMAEGLVNYTRLDDPEHLVTGTQGRPLSDHDEVRVVDDADHDVPDGTVGHLLTRGPYTLRGYYRAGAHNATAFTADGFYRTGDLVRRLPTGHLVVEGRAKDQINRGGEKIGVEEVEDHLLAHPHVHDVAVVGVPDPVLGERTCAVVVPRGAAPGEGELRAFVRGRGVAAYKVPDLVRLVRAFPRTGVGKVSRAALRADLAARLAGPGAPGAEVRREVTVQLPCARAAEALAVGPVPLPGPDGRWTVRRVHAGTDDARRVAAWMRTAHVARFWDQAWSDSRWDEQFDEQNAQDFSAPCLVLLDHRPVAYLELYRAARDLVALHLPTRPDDVGVHLAVGGAAHAGHGLGRALLAHTVRSLRSHDPQVRVVMEPDERNDAAVRCALAAGFTRVDVRDLGHKRAVLLVHDGPVPDLPVPDLVGPDLVGPDPAVPGTATTGTVSARTTSTAVPPA